LRTPRRGSAARQIRCGSRPGHIPHENSDGWANETFLVKCRLLSANEEQGNYIVTAFMGFSAPTGDDSNSNRHGIFTPTIAAGKGFGNFDIQSTAGISLPDGGLQRLGMPLAWNTAFQYRYSSISRPNSK